MILLTPGADTLPQVDAVLPNIWIRQRDTHIGNWQSPKERSHKNNHGTFGRGPNCFVYLAFNVGKISHFIDNMLFLCPFSLQIWTMPKRSLFFFGRAPRSLVGWFVIVVLVQAVLANLEGSELPVSGFPWVEQCKHYWQNIISHNSQIYSAMKVTLSKI